MKIKRWIWDRIVKQLFWEEFVFELHKWYLSGRDCGYEAAIKGEDKDVCAPPPSEIEAERKKRANENRTI